MCYAIARVHAFDRRGPNRSRHERGKNSVEHVSGEVIRARIRYLNNHI